MNPLLRSALATAVVALSFQSLQAAPPDSGGRKKSPKPAATAPYAKAKAEADTGIFQPDSAVRIVFPAPMISPASVGSPLQGVEITPSLSGSWSWKNTVEASLHLAEPPVPGTAYRVTFSRPLTALNGTPIARSVDGQLVAPPLEIAFLRNKSYVNPSSGPATAEFFVGFTDAVTPSQIAPRFVFSDSSARIVPAAVRAATLSETRSIYRAPLTWEERLGALTAPPTPDATPAADALDHPSPTVLVVRPARPLPDGNGWRLVIRDGIPPARGGSPTVSGTASVHWRIEPFRFVETGTYTEPGPSRSVFLRFNNQLAPQPENLSELVTFSPPVENLALSTGYNSISSKGDFAPGTTYRITLKPGIPAADGRATAAQATAEAKFEVLEPILSLPSHDVAQLSSGHRRYSVHSVNLARVRLRAKSLHGSDLVRAVQAFDHYNNRARKPDDVRTNSALPFELIPGKRVLDRSEIYANQPWDTIQTIKFSWDEILGVHQPGAVFFSAEGFPREDYDSWETRSKRPINQTIVQVTDIGFIWKRDTKGWIVYAFSCTTGKPLADADLEAYGEEAAPLGKHRTGPDGTTRIPDYGEVFTLRLAKGADQYAITADSSLDRIPLYRFPIQYADRPQNSPVNAVVMFTDRGVYRPGETARIKGIWRKRFDAQLSIPGERSLTFSVRDPDDRVIYQRDIPVSPYGSFDQTVSLPDGATGEYIARVDLPRPDNTAAQTDEEESEFDWDPFPQRHVFTHEFQVQEFRRNTFEIHLDPGQTTPDAHFSKVALRANYLMGKPLSEASLQWFTRVTPAGFYPENYSGYVFGDHGAYNPYYWFRYFGFRDNEMEDESGTPRAGEDTKEGKLALSQDGTAEIPVPLPKREFPGPLTVNVRAEVTDVNQQTLAESASYEIPGSEFYLGIARIDALNRVGREVPVSLFAVARDGQPYRSAVEAEVEVLRDAWITVQTATPNGDSQPQNTRVTGTVFTSRITLQPAEGGAKADFTFTPQESGAHMIVVRANDRNGAPIATRFKTEVYGANYAWEYEDGARIRLVPDKRQYAPGDTARLLVMTPIDGKALVAVERRDIHRHFVADLSSANPVLEIPVTTEDSPNVYVSVSLIKGAKENLREIKEPVIKLGYCQLRVTDDSPALKVSIANARDTIRPGEEALVEGLVTRSDGTTPAPDAEVTLWAVDEGVLQVVRYKNPDPLRALMPRQPLSVTSGATLAYFLGEDPRILDTLVNKGFMAGGGGDLSALAKLRKNFDPCAFWAASIKTGPDGRFRARFKAPDTLTRYRILAVALGGPFAIGVGAGALTVNKPVMLEPSFPRAAATGDRLLSRAILHNTSEVEAEFDVTLDTGDSATLTSASERIRLKPNETRAVSFDATLTDTGTAMWTWSAKPVALPQGAPPPEQMSDAVESRFPVHYPVPLSRQVAFAKLAPGETGRDAFALIRESIRNGAGTIEVEISPSRLQEAAEAIRAVLTYPYGCAEQTTSSLMPWFSARDLRDAVPALDKTDAEIEAAIAAGAKRLLSMQTASGGLAYWPGGREPTPWATAYAGLALVMANQSGVPVPDEALDKLLAYLAELLHGTSLNPYERCRALYTLAIAGRPDHGFMAKLRAGGRTLGPDARAWLALAMDAAGLPKPEIAAFLREPETRDVKPGDDFLSLPLAPALQLQAWCKVEPDAPEVAACLDRLLAQRDGSGHWRSTLNNATGIAALAAYARAVNREQQPVTVTWDGDGLRETWVFDRGAKARSAILKFPRAVASRRLAVSLDGPGGAYLAVRAAMRPEHDTAPDSDDGFSIQRTHFRVNPDGSTEPLADARVGDLVLVSLRFHVPVGGQYIAVDDPLPATLGAVNPALSEEAAGRANLLTTNWIANHAEYRDDRVVFFADFTPPGHHEVRYLARVTGAGEVSVPPAQIEAMYAPERRGTSASTRLVTSAAR